MHFWGPITSTLDWCEHNYAHVEFIAELWNTLSNGGLMGLGLLGLYRSWQQQLETRFLISYFGLFLIGVGSFCFHATLRWDMQLLDELPMIYSTCVFVFCVLEDRRKLKYGPILPLGLLVLAIFITVTYLSWPNPIFHQFCYGTLVIIVVGKCVQVYQNTTDQTFRFFLPIGIISYGFGFFLWNVDNHFCEQLRQLREKVFPFSPLFELHAWWHLFTALGTYLYIFLNTYMRAKTLGQKVKVIKWLGLPLLHVETGKKQLLNTLQFFTFDWLMVL